MKGKDLLQALDQVDERFVDEAEAPLGRGGNRGFFWIAAAACLFLVFVGAMLLPWGQNPPEKTGYPAGVQLSNETLAHAGSSDGAIPTLAPADLDPGSPADSGELTGNGKAFGVILRITQWTDSGLDAVVAEMEDSPLIPAGTIVKVVFSQDCMHAISIGDQNFWHFDGPPDKSQYPPGSLMSVHFYAYDDGILYVNDVSPYVNGLYPGGVE